MRQLRAGSLLLLILGAIAWGAAPALAQISDLPQAVIESTALTPEQTATIAAYVKAKVEDLESGDPAKIKRGREDLESPATNAGATIAFRTAYSDAMLADLDRLGKSDSEVQVISAVQVAGTLATGPGIALCERYRGDKRPAVRFAAVYGLRDSLRSISRMPPVIGPSDAATIVDNLATGLGGETDAPVADMYVRALLEATNIQRDKFQAVPERALGRLVEVIGARVRKLAPGPADLALLQAITRAGENIRDVLAADVLAKRKPEAFARDVGGLGGDILAYIFRRVRAGGLPVAKSPDQSAIDDARAAREADRTLTQLGLTLVFSASDRLARGPVPTPPKLADLLNEASAQGDRQFVQEAGSIIGDGGLLTKDPFKFNPDRFLGPH